MEERNNILKILKKTLQAVKENNPDQLKDLSDQTIHSASTGHPDNITVAVIVYSLGKILSRKDYRTLKGWSTFQKTMISSLEKSIEYLEKNDDEKFRENFVFIRKAINKLSGKLKKYVEEVFEKADIAKASRIYEHGISLGKTAKMLGISMYELQNYAGQTGISEVSLNKTINPKTRIKMLEELFQK
jgi:translation initiation factor 2B subunit (eIF-2B alpha/beta/delta family)